MTKSYVCGACGQEVNKYKDQCPYCKASGDNLVANPWGMGDFEDYDDLDGYGYDDTE